MSKQQKHRIKQTIHQQTTTAVNEGKSVLTKIIDHIRDNPADALLTIIGALLVDANMALDDIEDLNTIQAAADLDMLDI